MNAQPSLHPTDRTLSAYGLGQLDDAAAGLVHTHLEGCPDCRRRVAEVTSDSFLGRLRDARGRTDSLRPSVSATEGLPLLDAGAAVAMPPPADTLPPGLADHPDYEIIRELGRGGMGVVYLAQNTLMGRMEVLKVVGGHLVSRPGVLDRFLREIRVRRQAPAPQHRGRVLGPAPRREPGLRDGIRRRARPGQDWSRPRGRCQWPTPAATCTRRRWASSTRTNTAWSTATSSRTTSSWHGRARGQGDRQGARLRPGQGHQRRSAGQRPDPRGPDAGHARLHRARADPRCPVGRHPRRHLQPGLHAVLSPERRAAVPVAPTCGTSTRRISRWTPGR